MEETKVWLAPVFVEEYEGEQDPVYMCRKCVNVFVDNNREFHFENLLYSVKDAAGKYKPQILENWK